MILQNEKLKLKILAAGQEYTGTRFDWNGTISQIEFIGAPLLSKEKQGFAFNKKTCGQGLHNEFGIKNCIGYDEIPIGEWFPKIGVGWLKKDARPYSFANRYELQKAQFSFEQTQTAAKFFCTTDERNGYAYNYTKTITLCQSGFTIDYELQNTGSKKIETTEYVHNFLCPANKPISPKTKIQVPWHFDSARLVENVQTAGILEVDNSDAAGSKIEVKKIPDKIFFMGGLWQARTDTPSLPNGRWVLQTENLSLSEIDSFEPCNCDIWGYKKNISIEMFAWISAAPGQTANWQRRYIVEEK